MRLIAVKRHRQHEVHLICIEQVFQSQIFMTRTYFVKSGPFTPACSHGRDCLSERGFGQAKQWAQGPGVDDHSRGTAFENYHACTWSF